MTARESGSVAGWLCAPARLIEVCLTEACGRFPGHRDTLGHTCDQHRHLQAILRVIGTGVATGLDQPVRADDPIRNT